MNYINTFNKLTRYFTILEKQANKEIRKLINTNSNNSNSIVDSNTCYVKYFSKDNKTKESNKEILVDKEDIIISNRKEEDKNNSNYNNSNKNNNKYIENN